MKFLADENFDYRIVRGLLRRRPEFDIVRVQDLEIAGADDPTVLGWAARAGRTLLTHDERTVPATPMNGWRPVKRMLALLLPATAWQSRL